MTPEQARQIIARYPNALNFVKQSHLEELSPLFEVHIEVITVRKDEFHDLKGSFMPRKETLDKFAQAAGVSFNATADTTRKEGDGCYVGTAQAMLMGPDGKWGLGPICEYEFDVDVRLEEMELNGKADWENKVGNRPGSREYTPKELAQERVQLRKVARQRANTGARNRATVAVLGMQTGFKNLYSKNEPDTATRVFLFSRVIVNAKNEIVLNRMLDNIAGPTQALYGSQEAVQIAGPTHQIAAPAAVDPAPYAGGYDDEPRNVTSEAEDLAASALTGGDGFDDEPGNNDTGDDREALVVSLEQYLASGTLNDKAAETVRTLINTKAPIEQLASYLDLLKKGRGLKTRAVS